MRESQNPKDLIAKNKIPMGNLPSGGVYHSCQAIEYGARRYGPLNWRSAENAIGSRTYINACLRHIYAWLDGENVAQDSGIHHLGHAVAGLLILMDAEACGTMIDDRGLPGALPRLLNPIANASDDSRFVPELYALPATPAGTTGATLEYTKVPDWWPNV